MKLKTYVAGISIAVLYCIASSQAGEASQSDTKTQILMYARRGGDDSSHHDDDNNNGHRSRQRYYRYHRYYPQDYYYYNKIYYYPFKRYYYYYDVYPEKIYYYQGEKDTFSANPNYLPITSIASMASQGIPDAVIIAEIERTHSVYNLNSEVITYLKQNGASDRLIDFMIETGRKY